MVSLYNWYSVHSNWYFLAFPLPSLQQFISSFSASEHWTIVNSLYTLYEIGFVLLFLTYFTFHNAFQINLYCLRQQGFHSFFETEQYFMDEYHILKSTLLWASRLRLSCLLWILMLWTWWYTGDQSPCSFLFFHILSFLLSYNNLTYKWHSNPSPIFSLECHINPVGRKQRKEWAL